VPARWDNEEDLPGNFLLLPPGMKLDGVDAGTSDYIGVYTQVAPDPGCATPSGQPGDAPHAMAMCIAGRHDLAATKLRSVKIGGLSGYVVDVHLVRVVGKAWMVLATRMSLDKQDPRDQG
jgi:hypothetical protein